jgi:hypothetical protein
MEETAFSGAAAMRGLRQAGRVKPARFDSGRPKKFQEIA